MADITNVQMGTCDVEFNSADLGHTAGGVTVTYEAEYSDHQVDLYGNTVVDKRLLGERLIAEVPLAEFTVANLRNAIPQAQFAGAANARITIGAKAGKKASDDAAQLVLHPSQEGTRRHDVVLHKAYVESVEPIPHTNEDQKILMVTFVGLLDESKADGNYIGLIGDSTA
jgi:hypothetical protein